MPETGQLRKGRAKRGFPKQLVLPLGLLCFAAFLNIMAALYNAVEYYSLPCSVGDAMTLMLDGLPLKGENLTNSSLLMQYLSDTVQRQQLLDALTEVTKCSQTMVPMHMSYSDGLYLAMTLSTGAGYGVIIPRTVGGKWIAIFNAFIGLTLALFCYILLGKVMWNKARRFLSHSCFERHKRFKFISKMVILVLVGHVLFMFIPCAIVMYIEAPHRWSYLDTYYCLITTVGSIGLGDFTPAKFVTDKWVDVYRIGLYTYFILGCAYIVCIIRAFVEGLDKKGPIIEHKIIQMARSVSSLHLPHHSNSHSHSALPAENSRESSTTGRFGGTHEVLNPATLSLGGHHHHVTAHSISGDSIHEEKHTNGRKIETGHLHPPDSTTRRHH